MKPFPLFAYVVIIILISSCGGKITSSSSGVKNSDTTRVPDGRGVEDTVRYTCDSCEKYIKTQQLLNKIIEHATNDAKAALNNPFSFVPRSIKISVFPRDSFYYFGSNKHVDNCKEVNIEYKALGKNAYGTEGEANSSSVLFLVDDSIRNNFGDEIRLPPLAIVGSNDQVLNRELTLYDIDGDGNFRILPTVGKLRILIVTSSQSCIDKGARLYINFADSTEISLRSWNDFNCKGTAYFYLTPQLLEKFANKELDHISFFADKQQYGRVDKNESDYFMQYAGLLSKLK